MNTYPLDIDSPVDSVYPPFEQMGPDIQLGSNAHLTLPYICVRENRRDSGVRDSY